MNIQLYIVVLLLAASTIYLPDKAGKPVVQRVIQAPSVRFPAETVGYKPVGKPDCQSVNMAGLPPMNTCEQKYSNGKLTLTVSVIEYPKGNPTLVAGTDQGDDSEAGSTKSEKISVGALTGRATYTPKSKFADVSLHKGDRLTVSISGQGQPNAEAAKALARALK